MGELIDFESYKNRHDESEIKKLQSELNDLIEEMGGATTGPIMSVSEYPSIDSLYVLNNPSMWYSFEYLAQDVEDEK